MKKMAPIIVMALMMAMALQATAQTTGSNSPELSINFLNQDPVPVEPGNFFKVRFKLENIGLAEARNIDLEILPEYPFSIYQDSSVKNIASLSPRQKDTQAVYVSYILRVDEKAVPGDYPVDIRYNIGGSAWRKADPFTISVKQQTVIVTLDSVTTEPNVVRPGENVKLKLDFLNIANTPVKYLTVNLGLISVLSTTTAVSITELPFSPVSSSNVVVFPLLNPKQKVSAVFELVTDSDAASKVYKVPVGYSYSDASNANYSKTNYVSLVVGDKPEMVVNLDSSEIYTEGTKGEIIIKFVNKGLNQVKFLYAKLQETGDYTILSPKDVYVGNIDSDDYETVSYSLFVNQGVTDVVELPVVVEYKDVNNNDYRDEVKLTLRIYSEDEAKMMGFTKTNNMWAILLVVAVAIVGYIIYRRRSKKK